MKKYLYKLDNEYFRVMVVIYKRECPVEVVPWENATAYEKQVARRMKRVIEAESLEEVFECVKASCGLVAPYLTHRNK